MIEFMLLLAAGFAVGIVFHRFKVPGGMMVGGIVGSAALHIVMNTGPVPVSVKVIAQALAGAYIATTIDREMLVRLRFIGKPAAIIMTIYLAANLAAGFLICSISPLDLATALFSAVPGGMSDIPLIAIDMGADGSKVAAMQFARMVVGMSVFPSLINAVCKKEAQNAPAINPAEKTKNAGQNSLGSLLVTLAAAFLSGSAGFLLGIPGGTLAFSLAGVMILKLRWGKAHFPFWLKRFAQLLSGVYIGCLVSPRDLVELRVLPVPAIILLLTYSGVCFFDGWLLPRACGMTRKEAMLAATPTGASDMALISMDMGVQSVDLVVLQVLRLIVVSAIFPQILGVILRFSG